MASGYFSSGLDSLKPMLKKLPFLLQMTMMSDMIY